MSVEGKGQASRSSGSAQLTRQWAILQLLKRREYSIRELADELGTSKSSVQRDITTLQEHFMIVALPVGQQKRVYRLARSGPELSLKVSPGELAALERAIHAVEGHTPALASLVNKLRPLVEPQ
jgi:predicted DNA-binding transcriptional regulator YafY